MYGKLKNNKFICNCLMILSFLVLSFVGVAILLHSNTLFRTADIQFHFRRAIELKRSIEHGDFFPDFSFNQFHGSASMLFYPYLNIIPMVLLSFMIKSKIIIFYVFVMFNTFLTFIIALYSSKSYIKNNSTAYIFSVIYSLSNVLLAHTFLSGDFGIVSSFTFIPLVIFGFVNLLLRRNSGWLQLSLGMIFIAFSHILNTFIIGIFLLLWLIMNFKRLNKIMIINLCKSVILFIIMTSLVWLPILSFYINKNSILTPEVMQLRRIDIITFLSGFYGKKTPETLGFFSLIAIFIFPFFYKKSNYIIKQMYILSIIISLIVLFLPWQLLTSKGILQALNHFQFTYRLLIIPNILLSFIFAFIVTKYIMQSHKKYIIYTFIIFIAIFSQLIDQYSITKSHTNALPIDHYLNEGNKYTDLNHLPDYVINNSSQLNKMINAYSSADNDYIPQISVSIADYVNKNIGFYNYNYKKEIKHIGYNKFEFSGNKNIYRISLPIYMYNNEKLHVYLNGKDINYFSDKNGLLTIDGIKNKINKSNTIYIKPVPNIFKIIGVILSIIALLFILFLIIKSILI